MEKDKYKRLTREQIDGAISFHGHLCPGLTIGARAAEWALNEFGRAGDEDIVCVTETDMCGVDAIQFLTGCTFGKGNFIFRETGKIAFSFYRRRDGMRGRIVMRPNFAPELAVKEATLAQDDAIGMQALRQERIEKLWAADIDEIFNYTEPRFNVPERARIHATILCEECGEGVMATKIVEGGGRKLCTDCAARRRA
ncbi:MAG: TraR/DksA C4-type zinc finger protein [Thermoguttaceae bacterium]|nr:TraR/DksA C4-type zinc finger protein [Thermoguttaceae bacterium]